MRQRGSRRFLLLGLVVVCYAAGSLLAWHGFGANNGLAFFPPAGVTTAALILSPRRSWPGLLVAVLVTEVAVDVSQGLPALYALGYGVANAVEPLAGAVVFDRLNRARVPLDHRRGKLTYLFGACGVGGLMGALIGGAVSSQHRPETRWVSNVLHWWAGDGLAILAIGASIVLVATARFSARQAAELTVGAVVTGIASMIGLNSMLAPSTLVLPLVTILAFRVGPAGATVGGSVFALVANYATNAGHGYFAQLDTSPTNRLALLQVFIAILVIVGWSIGVEALGRIDAVTASVKIELERDEATAALRAIHRAIGPTNAATIGPFDVGSCYRQSQVSGLVGGDWFDAFALVQGRLMFVVGDVVGHGIDAMEDMAQLRLASRAFAMEGHTPSRILEELNVFTRNGTRGHFATMVVGIYEPSDQCLVVASAGHPPPLIRRSGWSSEYVAVAPGPPLGVSDHATYHGSALPLSGADVVVLYTDGVIERRGHPLDDGLRQLSELLDATDPNDPPDGICEQLIDRCFADVAALDDRCMLVIRVRG